MHSFQPIPSEMFDFSPFKIIGKDWMLVLSESRGKTNALTASWGGLGVIWGKDVAFIFIRKSRYTKEFIDASDTFSLNFFNEGYRGTLKYFGTVSGRDEDKIHNARMNIDYIKGVPVFDEASTVMICRKMFSQELSPDSFIDKSLLDMFYSDKDYHTLYVGEIMQIGAR